MFECNQEITLLQNALESAVKHNSGNLCKLKRESKERVIATISNSIKIIVQHQVRSVSDNVKRQTEAEDHVNKRLHAALFFNVLKSYDIISDAATNFYGSVSYRWPLLDFDLYVELNYKENWSEHFIKSASQLPNKALLVVLKHLLCLSSQSHIKCYLWHLIFQSIYHKIMKVPADDVSACSFDFDFECKSALSENEQVKTNFESTLTDLGDINCLTDIYNLLYDELLAQKNPSRDILYLLLHSVKTLMKYKHKCCSKELLRVYEILDQCLRLENSILILKESIDTPDSNPLNSQYLTTAWGIPFNYLILVINYYYYSLLPEELLNLKNILGCSEIPYFFPVILKDISPYTRNYFHVQKISHLEMLFKIIECQLEGAPYAAEVLMSNPVLLESDTPLQILEVNCMVIDFKNVYPLMLESIVAIGSKELKLRLLKLFYKLLAMNSSELCNEVLKYILSTFGYTDEFQLPDYDEKLSMIVRQASAVQNAEPVLLSLFVQSPKETLKCLIEEVLSQGQDGKYFVQILKLIPQACTYSKTVGDVTPLIEILLNHLQKAKIEEYEFKNFPILFQLLMDVHDVTEVLDLNLFLNKWAVPYLEKSDKFDLISSCLKVIFGHLTTKEISKLKQGSQNAEVAIQRKPDILPDTFKMLISSLALQIHSAVESGCGRSKETYLSLLEAFEQYQLFSDVFSEYDRKEMKTLLLPLNEVVQMYNRVFLPDDHEYKMLSTEWLWTIKMSDFWAIIDKFEDETFSYTDFMNILVQIVPHLTADEWKISMTNIEDFKTLIQANFFNFMKEAFQYLDLPFQMSDSNQETYAIIHAFIMSLHFTLPEAVNESLYTCSCMCSALDTLVKKLKKDLESSAQLILAIYLDLCFLMSCLEPDLIPAFSPILFQLKEGLSLFFDSSGDSDLNKLLIDTVKCLPDSSEKDALLQKMAAF